MNRASNICTVTRIGRLWDAILVTDDGFGALMCKKCAQPHRLGLRRGCGGGGWGGDTIEGGSANRELGSYISPSPKLPSRKP